MREDKTVRRDSYIWASDLAQYAFCPESERLSSLGVEPSRKAQARMEQGKRAHAVWQAREDERVASRRAGHRRLAWVALGAIGLVGLLLWGWWQLGGLR